MLWRTCVRYACVCVDEPELCVEVRARSEQARCPGCGLGGAGVQDRVAARFAIAGRLVTLVWKGACSTAVTATGSRWEDHPEFEDRNNDAVDCGAMAGDRRQVTADPSGGSPVHKVGLASR